MSNLLAKRYKNNKALAEAKVEQGKKLAEKQDAITKQEQNKSAVVEKVQVSKEVKTLMLD